MDGDFVFLVLSLVLSFIMVIMFLGSYSEQVDERILKLEKLHNQTICLECNSIVEK